MRVALVHPQLLAGGAERVMLDAALELQQRGHTVVVLTAGRAPEASFAEFNNGTIEVHELCSRMPRRIFGRCRAACTVIRSAVVALRARRWRGQFDAVLCDQIAHTIPLLRRSLGAPVVYYCHFPDRLLAVARNAPQRLYRWPIDGLERSGLRAADLVLVNSRFTAQAFAEAFPHLPEPAVLHPGVDLAAYEDIPAVREDGHVTFLSIARFEPAKNSGLAIDAFAELRQRLTSERFSCLRLILAGSYDARAHESVATVRALEQRAADLKVAREVELVVNPNEAACRKLLADCRCFLYTPRAEHFGIAPLEAMAAGRPVIAVEHGGPAETISHGTTGFLHCASPQAFANAMEVLVRRPDLALLMGAAGRERVRRLFQRDRFGESLEKVLQSL